MSAQRLYLIDHFQRQKYAASSAKARKQPPLQERPAQWLPLPARCRAPEPEGPPAGHPLLTHCCTTTKVQVLVVSHLSTHLAGCCAQDTGFSVGAGAGVALPPGPTYSQVHTLPASHCSTQLAGCPLHVSRFEPPGVPGCPVGTQVHTLSAPHCSTQLAGLAWQLPGTPLLVLPPGVEGVVGFGLGFFFGGPTSAAG